MLDSRRYHREIDQWLADLRSAEDKLVLADKAYRGVFTSSDLRLEPGERLVSVWRMPLAELRGVTNVNWGSYSRQVGSGRARVGHAQSTSTEELRQIDFGNVAITDRRILFQGRTTRAMKWRAVSGCSVSTADIRFHSDGRKQPLILLHSKASTKQLSFEVDVARSADEGTELAMLRSLRGRVASLSASPPALPHGVEPDQRVPGSSGSPPTAIGSPAPLVSSSLPSDSAPPIGCFIRTDASKVAVAAAWIGHSVRLASWPGESSMLQNPSLYVIDVPAIPGVKPTGLDLLVVDAVGDEAWQLLDALTPQRCVIVASTPFDHLNVLDAREEEPNVRYADPQAALQLEEHEKQAGANVLRLDGSMSFDNDFWSNLATRTRLLRAMTGNSQILLLHNPEKALATAGLIEGFDELVLVSPETPDEKAAEEYPVPAATPAFTVAGTVIEQPARRVHDYICEHPRTVKAFDLPAGHYTSITPELVGATRRPFMNSRISADEERWFIGRGEDAPWHLVAADADLRGADPGVKGGVYDNAVTLYEYFRQAAPKGVSGAKIHKVLHLMRPRMFPILDTRLLRYYEKAATAAAKELNQLRPELVPTKRAYWAAIRNDLCDNTDALAAARAELMRSPNDFVATAVSSLGDVRLLDMVTWNANTDDDLA